MLKVERTLVKYISEKILTMYFNHVVLAPVTGFPRFVRLIWIRILVIAGTNKWRTKQAFYKCENKRQNIP